MQLDHHPVPGHLGEHATPRRCRRRPGRPSRPRGRARPARHGEPVGEHVLRPGSRARRARGASPRCWTTCRPRAVDLLGRDAPRRDQASGPVQHLARRPARGPAAVSSLESASPGTTPRRPSAGCTAATTSGPAHAPRPASSAPATGREAAPAQASAPSPRGRCDRRAAASGSGAGAAGGGGRSSGHRRPTLRRPWRDRSRERLRAGPAAAGPARRRRWPGGRATAGRTAEEVTVRPARRGADLVISSAARAGTPTGQTGGDAGAEPVGPAGAAGVARGEHQRDRVRPVAGTQLAQDGLDVGLDGVLADEQVAADLAVRLALAAARRARPARGGSAAPRG